MKKNIVFVLLSHSCFALPLDSALINLLNIKSDTERVNQIYQSGFELRNKEPLSAMQYGKICVAEAKKTNSVKHLAKSYNLLGIMFYKKGDYAQALHYQKQALQLNISINYETGIGINYINLGNIYSELKHYYLSETCYLKAITIYNKLNNPLQLCRCLLNIGTLKQSLKLHTAALNQFREAYNAAVSINNIELISDCINNIGSNYIELNELDSAQYYLEKALKMRDFIGNQTEKTNSYNNLATLFILKKQFYTAHKYLQLSFQLSAAIEFTDGKIELYKNYANYYEAQNDFQNSIIWIKKYYQLRDSIINIEKDNHLENWVNEPLHEDLDKQQRYLFFIYGLIGGILSYFSLKLVVFIKKYLKKHEKK